MPSAPSDRPASITPEFASEHHLTPNDVATIFGVNPKTVARWAASGVLPCITTPGGHRRFREADVTELLNRTRTTQDHGRPEPGGA